MRLRRFIAGNGNVDLLGQEPDRLRKFHPLLLHDKVYDIAANPAAETMENLLVWVDDKRRRLFMMERTHGLETPPRALKRDIRGYGLNDIATIDDLRNDLFRDESHAVSISWWFRDKLPHLGVKPLSGKKRMNKIG